MASANPILVSPSTTIVQVNPLASPFTSVLLNSYAYAGQLVTVVDGTSSFGVLQTPIVVSTVSQTQFTDGSISTLINQPQGTLTAQAQSPNLWAILNSFPFRNQYISAGVQNLNVSTLFTSSLSTLQEFTSSLIVENLFVSGNFSQSSGLVLNQTISSLGNVDLYSTITVWQSTFFSSALSTIGDVFLVSSLTVGGNLFVPSTVRFLSSVSVQENVSLVGYLSTSLVRLGSTLNTNQLFVQSSDLTSIDVGGDIRVNGLLRVLGSLNSGSNFTSYRTSVGAFSTFSSMAVAGSVYVDSNTTFLGALSTQGALSIRSLVSVAGDAFLQGNASFGSTLSVNGSTFVKGFFSSVNLLGEEISVSGNLGVSPALTNPTRVENITIRSAFGVGSIDSVSTTIGGRLSTTALLYVEGSLYGQSSMTVNESFHTSQSFSTLENLYSLGALSTLGNVLVNGSTRIDSNVYANTVYLNQSNISSAYFAQDLSILGNLTVTQTMKLSSITLISSVLANSFETSTLAAGYEGIFNSTFISSLKTSSLGTGGVYYPEFTMDMSNELYTVNLSTFLLSSLLFLAQSEGTFAPSTFFTATNSFGVNIRASTNTMDVNTIAYTLCNTNVLNIISTNAVFGDTLLGTLRGNGELLSNVGYPAGLSTSFLETSSLKGRFVSTFNGATSTLITDALFVKSTLGIGPIGFFGNADLTDLSNNPLSNLIHVAAPINRANLLFLNTMSIYGNSAETIDKQVVVNSNLFQIPLRPLNPPAFLTRDIYTLAADAIRVSSVVSPNFSLNFDTVDGDILRVNTLNANSVYVSSGRLGLSPGFLLLPEDEQISVRSTNTIQSYQSTLIFNSTLFVNFPISSVGINTFPYYKLDVFSNAFVPNLYVSQSTLITNRLNMRGNNQTSYNLSVGPQANLVYLLNNPLSSFTQTLQFPYLAYSPSSFEFNKTMYIDTNANVNVSYTSSIVAYQSTFLVGGSTFVSGSISTNRLVCGNGLFLSMQFV